MSPLRSLLIAIFCISLFTLTSCSPSKGQTLSISEATSQGAVLAIRISPQIIDFAYGGNRGWIALVAEDGSIQAVDIGAMDIGQVLWTDEAVYFSSLYDEFSLTDAGLNKLSRNPEEAVQTSIFPKKNEDGYISLYNVGFLENGYGYRVVAGDINGFDSWDVDGLYSSLHDCDGRIVGITGATELAKDSPGFIHRKFINEGKESIDVLRVLYPKDEALEKNYLGIVKNNTVLEQQTFNAPCADGIAYALGVSYIAPEDSVAPEDIPPQDIVLRAWNTQTGEHKIYPITPKDGKPLSVTQGDVNIIQGLIIGSNYLWSSFNGVLLSTDITNGITEEIANLSNGHSQFHFTETGVFVLDFEYSSSPAEFFFYEFETNQMKHIFTIDDLPYFFKNGRMDSIVRDIAVRPSWVKQRFASTTDTTPHQ